MEGGELGVERGCVLGQSGRECLEGPQACLGDEVSAEAPEEGSERRLLGDKSTASQGDLRP